MHASGAERPAPTWGSRDPERKPPLQEGELRPARGAEWEGRQLPAAGWRSRSGAGSDSHRSSLASSWALAAGPASAQWRGSATNEAPPAPGAPPTSSPAAKAAPPSGRRRVAAAETGVMGLGAGSAPPFPRPSAPYPAGYPATRQRSPLASPLRAGVLRPEWVGVHRSHSNRRLDPNCIFPFSQHEAPC